MLSRTRWFVSGESFVVNILSRSCCRQADSLSSKPFFSDLQSESYRDGEWLSIKLAQPGVACEALW
jgi:hypothetical protein